MAILIYVAIASLDGYVEDEQGKFDWAAPDEEVHAFVNDLERPVGTYLYGRRMYETMAYWETDDNRPPVYRDYAEIWRAAEKVVYSRTLQEVSSERTRIEREFDGAAIKRLKESSRSDIAIGGAELAGQAIAEGLVDECHLFLGPVLSWCRQTCPTRRRPCRARVAGRAPLSQRRRIPSLPHPDLSCHSRAQQCPCTPGREAWHPSESHRSCWSGPGRQLDCREPVEPPVLRTCSEVMAGGDTPGLGWLSPIHWHDGIRLCARADCQATSKSASVDLLFAMAVSQQILECRSCTRSLW